VVWRWVKPIGVYNAGISRYIRALRVRLVCRPWTMDVGIHANMTGKVRFASMRNISY